MADDLEAKFKQAADDAQQLDERPDNDTLLELYALYKQGTKGDVAGKRPGFTKPVKRAKFDAWADKKGMPLSDAQQAYVDLVEQLKGS